ILTPEEAFFASFLSLFFQPVEDILPLVGISEAESRDVIKSMANKGLIHLNRTERGIEVKLLPFIVGIYENQNNRIDQTLAQLMDDYFHEAFYTVMSIKPQFHRVIPIHTAIDAKVEILPEESVSEILMHKKAWAVIDCICRKQQGLLGKACDHPLRVCLIMSEIPGAFDGQSEMDVLDLNSALDVLDQAASAGLVHTVSNHKGDISYICNCCTCGCGILRAIAEAHIANVVARSSYFAKVDDESCLACGNCEAMCQFGAINITECATVDKTVCVGCGVCVRFCPEDAISLQLRDPDEILDIPNSYESWLKKRSDERISVS
ncbi:MAG: 4Fe-4S binding protein, partial [Anaerolineales bacterium]